MESNFKVKQQASQSNMEIKLQLSQIKLQIKFQAYKNLNCESSLGLETGSTFIKTLSLALALVCLNLKIPNPDLINPNIPNSNSESN